MGLQEMVAGIYIYIYPKSFQLCPTLYNPMDCSLPGSSVHRIFQARILEWVAISSSRDMRVCVCVFKQIAQHLLDHRKSKRVPKKQLPLLHGLH